MIVQVYAGYMIASIIRVLWRVDEVLSAQINARMPDGAWVHADVFIQ